MNRFLKLVTKLGMGLVLMVALALGVSVALSDPNLGKTTSGKRVRAARPTSASKTMRKAWNRREDGSPMLYGDGWLDDSGYFFAVIFTGAIDDPNSLEQVGAALSGRAAKGVSYLNGVLASVPPDAPDGPTQIVQLHLAIGGLYMYSGDFDAAEREFSAAREFEPKDDLLVRANYDALLGLTALRRGEVENCVMCCNENSCIFPLAAGAIHRKERGSREALRRFSAYLEQRPEDLGVRWLLNVAAMTLGEYPDKVPPKHLISREPFESRIDIGRFPNVAAKIGLDPGGNMAGGSIFDDFTGDGLFDVFTSTADPTRGARLFVNKGDGTFQERSENAGLGQQIAALNCNQADFDNDGDLDVYLMRGGWEDPIRPSLLRNDGHGTFTDVTVASGVAAPIASQSAAWGDYDNDGDVDLFVAGEYLPLETNSSLPGAPPPVPDPRNYCRLFKNNGDGTFTDCAEAAGVLNKRRAKGSAWGDYDGDGRLDLYVSNSGQENRLYHNNGNGTFTDVAPELGVTNPIKSFSCWFFDYDNDGRQDLFVTGFSGTLSDVVRSHLGQPTAGERPRLYHNEGPRGFRDVTMETGLDRVMLVMGSNFGDLDNDGFLDIYLGTGQPAYFYVVPNVMLKNVEGKRFVDVTTSTGTGHLQKGHGISFADWDRDGDVDVFLSSGGATPGDQAHNILFQNPGHGNHWLSVKLVGTRSNRAAIGAEIRVDLPGDSGGHASRYRVIGSGSSFGGNCLAPTIGLGNATSIPTLEVHWPTTGLRQSFRNIPVDRAIEITEGHDEYRLLDWSPLPQQVAAHGPVPAGPDAAQ
jgi:hypothetical protein